MYHFRYLCKVENVFGCPGPWTCFWMALPWTCFWMALDMFLDGPGLWTCFWMALDMFLDGLVHVFVMALGICLNDFKTLFVIFQLSTHFLSFSKCVLIIFEMRFDRFKALFESKQPLTPWPWDGPKMALGWPRDGPGMVGDGPWMALEWSCDGPGIRWKSWEIPEIRWDSSLASPNSSELLLPGLFVREKNYISL